MRKDDWRNAVLVGPPASVFSGPILSRADYPAVLVAKAFSDGADLQLVLYPGGSQPTQTLGLERLKPGARYRVQQGNAEFVADAGGRAELNVVLQGRTELNIVPA